MKRILFLAALLALSMWAQEPRQHNTYTVQYDDSPAGTASVLTIQQPAASATNVEAMWAHIYCSVDCVVELERGGTAATATAATEVGTSSLSATAVATAWSDSDVGNGTTIDKFTIFADQPQSINLSAYRIWLIGNGTTKNFTLRSDSITGTVRMTISWREW